MDCKLVLLVLFHWPIRIVLWHCNSMFLCCNRFFRADRTLRRKLLLRLSMIKINSILPTTTYFSLSLVQHFLGGMRSLSLLLSLLLLRRRSQNFCTSLWILRGSDAARCFVIVHIKILLVKLLHSLFVNVWLYNLLNSAWIRPLLRSFDYSHLGWVYLHFGCLDPLEFS